MNQDLDQKAISTIRFLAADMVQKANSGHPGLPMGAAALAYTIWTRHLRHNPKSPAWADRDRFILSGGHGSALLYALLYLTGYDLDIEDLKSFRQWGSKTPGHPEWGLTEGVETTTGPLGQGFANGVGFAIAEAHLAEEFNRDGKNIIDHFVYAIVTDGDLMEGVASEAASLAGHLHLGKLIYLYDDNHISIDGSTELSFTEDRLLRFSAYGWHVQVVEDGNDVEALDTAIETAKKQISQPSIIACRTHIGFGLPTKQDTSKAHGEPPGEEELQNAKNNFGWPTENNFYIPEDVLIHFRQAIGNGEKIESAWNERFNTYENEHPALAGEYKRRLNKELPAGWDSNFPTFPPDIKGMATRSASGKVINALAIKLPELVGGSADLTPSNNTWINGQVAFQAENPEGKYLHFGVREHAMGAVVNGMAIHGCLIPFGSTFLVFSDYMRGAIRVGALSHYPSIWVFTHDSIGVGEDGPTHQPVEQIATLRAIPGLTVIRPGDANETIEAWKFAIAERTAPTALILTRQAVPVLDRNVVAPANLLARGAYVLTDLGNGYPECILMASGSEVSLILDAARKITTEGHAIRVVSFPSWELFTLQSEEYKNSVLLPDVKCRIAVEAGISQGWERWVGDHGKIISVNHYGASAPAKILLEKYGFTSDAIAQQLADELRKTTC